MTLWSDFLANLDIDGLLTLLVRVLAALICIILHECAHGVAAYALGDSTARRYGRLSWNPLRHIDPLGLLMMILVGFGWAKPVPVNMRKFRHPRRGMALTALAGPVSNVLLTMLALFIGGIMWRMTFGFNELLWQIYYYSFLLVLRVAVLSLGLALFNLIPIPPLDGSKILFSFLPERIYYVILRYERYVMVFLFVLVACFNVVSAPLNYCLKHVLYWLCLLCGFPPTVLGL